MKLLIYLLETPEGNARLKKWFYASLVVIALAETAAPYVSHQEAEFGFENLPAWESVYGFISCVLIIVVSKWLGKVWLMRDENYYDR